MTQPSARRSAVGAAIHSTMYVFGGVGAATRGESFLDVSDELWALDTCSLEWRLVSPSGDRPQARRCPGFAAHDGSLYLWGGSGVSAGTHTFLDDLWRFDPERERWEQLDAGPGPFARYVPVFTTFGEELMLFGGYTEDALGARKLADTWLFHPSRGWVALTERNACPPARYGAMAASTTNGVILFGGFSDRDLDDSWLLDVEGNWRELSVGANRPAARYYGAAGARGSELVVFGGRSRARPKENHNDLWTLDSRVVQWHRRAPDRQPHRYDASAPYPGYHAKSATAVIEQALYLWGGEGRVGHVSDLWRLELESLEWELLQPARDDDPSLW
jgi:N-acetylneuraminic acid mutarotase